MTQFAPVAIATEYGVMRELSTPAKALLMAVATLMIGFPALKRSRGDEQKSPPKMVARGDTALAYSAMTYVTWPKEAFDAANSPFVIGVLGTPSDAHEKILASYADGKLQIQGRQVRVQRHSNHNELGDCHVLVVAESNTPKRVFQALKKVRGKSVLTIGETADFAKSGGVLSLVKAGDESVLELNRHAAERQLLKVDVRLVNVSVLVNDR